MKVTGLTRVVVEDEYRQNVAPPEVQIYHDGRVLLKSLASQLLALTSLSDPALLEKVQNAAEKIQTPDDKSWTATDARIILDAVGVPPAPGHARPEVVPGHGLLLLRAVSDSTRGARPIRYTKKQPSMSLLRELRNEGIVIAEGTCMEVPVKLVEGESGLELALLLRRQRTRSLAEVQKTGENT